MRRCTFDLNPDPSFPGCVYSEMKMCLAPCFKGCTDEAYAAEVARVQEYFDSGGQSLLRELEADIDAVTLDGQDVPVKLKVFDSLFVPLAKWSMLLTGNYRCITPQEPQSIRDAKRKLSCVV